MTELETVLAAFRNATGCEAILWTQAREGAEHSIEAATPAAASPPAFPPTASEPPRAVYTARGLLLVAAVPGQRRAWLALGPCPEQEGQQAQLDSYLKFLLPVVGQYLQASLEVEHAASELAERYEEINLLYTISEILGRAVTLEETAKTILDEVSETVGARKASILVHDRVTDTLQVVAARGVDPREAPPISIDDQCSVSARVFRGQHPLIVEDGEMPCDAEAPYRRGRMLSVPIMWTAPNGIEPLGVVNLSDRSSGQPFTAGDQKLIAAIATQIGTAIQNARLVRASLNQQRLVQEMQLAHDLQMKLLPHGPILAPEAQVAARVQPAESVGGDLYNLFRLAPDRSGVMIGDVSSHGYRAALIMALTMSASAIHAQRFEDPGDMLGALFSSLREELETTEMFITAFYAVIDRTARVLRYANTGHPHAFHMTADGAAVRLAAPDPPLGMSEARPTTVQCPWVVGSDLLVLFTDGVSDARNRLDVRLGEETVLATVRRHRREDPERIVERLFEVLNHHIGETPRRDDLTIVVARS